MKTMYQYKLVLNIYRDNYAIVNLNNTLCRFYSSGTVDAGYNQLTSHGKMYSSNPDFINIVKVKEYI